MKASLKILDYNAKRDFVGWGVEEFSAIAGMPGFTHLAPLACVGPGAAGVRLGDLNGDGRGDLCLFGAAATVAIRSAGGSLDELALGLRCGARGADWADCDNDGRADLLLATTAGPKLYLNKPKSFTDASACLPRQGYYNLTAAAWIDFDADGRADILLADGFRGLRLYRNRTGEPAATLPTRRAGPRFEDVSDKVGLGAGGVAGRLKGDHLAVADVNGDGRPDVLYSAGDGVLALNTPGGFRAAKGCGIAYRPGGIAPAFGDFNGDRRIDLFVPQTGRGKLFANQGAGKFVDVTARAGDLAGPLGRATCAAWADLENTGRPGLLVGCLRGPNRYFRGNGDGTFTDAGAAIGLDRRVFNTRGVAVTDLNADGVWDVVFNNEGQPSAALLGNPAKLGRRPSR